MLNKNIKILEAYMNRVGKVRKLWDEYLIRFLEIQDIQTQRILTGKNDLTTYGSQMHEQEARLFQTSLQLIDNYNPVDSNKQGTEPNPNKKIDIVNNLMKSKSENDRLRQEMVRLIKLKVVKNTNDNIWFKVEMGSLANWEIKRDY